MKKTLIIVSAVLFVLLAGAEIYVQSDAFSGRIRPTVVGPLKAALGEGVEIGRVKASVIPLYIEVRDITFSDSDSKQIISVRKIRAYLNPFSLLLKKIHLSSISLLEPRLQAQRNKEGQLNIAPLVDRIKAAVARAGLPGQSRFTIHVRSIKVSNGTVEFKDDVTSAGLSLAGIHLTAGIDSSQERLRLAVKRAHVRFSAPSYPLFSGELTSNMEHYRDILRVDSAELTSDDATLAVSGNVGTSPGAVIDLRLSVKSGPKAIRRFGDFLKPGGKQRPSRMEATAAIRGTNTDPVIEGGMKVSSLAIRGMMLRDAALSFSYRSGTVSIRGEKWKLSQGDQIIMINSVAADLGYGKGVLDIRRFVVAGEDLVLRLEGRAGLSSGFDANLSAESSGKGRVISFFTSLPVEGAVGIRGMLTGELNSPRFDGTLGAGPVTVRGIRFDEVAGTLGYGNEKIRLSSVDIREKASRYIFSGSVDLAEKEPVYSAKLQVLRSDVVNIVALFYQQLPLRLSAEGELSFEGTARNYSGSGYLKLGPGSAYDESFARGAITAKLTTGRIAFPQVVLYKTRGVVKATGWIGFDGTYSADLESRDIDLASVDHLAAMPVAGEFKLDLHSSGSFSHPAAHASLDVEAFTFQQSPAGRLAAHAEIKDGMCTADAGLSEDRAALSVRWALRKPYTWTAVVNVKSPTIDPFLLAGNKELIDKVTVAAEGTITAHGRGLDASSMSGEISFKQMGLAVGDLRINNEADARIGIAGGKLVITSLNFTGPGTRISVTGWIKPLSAIDLDLKGTANLSLLKLLYHEIEHAGGTAEVKLTVKDSWNKPDVTGELRVDQGEVKVRDIPQRFTAMNGRLVFSQGRLVADSLSGEMGGGSVNISGWAQLAGVSLKDFSAKTVVENVMVHYPEGLASTLSGNLYYDGTASERFLSGDILIKRAFYDKRIEWKTMLVDVGRGLYQKKKTEVGWIGDTQVNVRFHGADNILFKNNLAAMSLETDVLLRGTVNRPQLLGRIESRKGVVYFRKNEFKILNASVDFVDPGRMNPVLDIQAETKVREYEIWLTVTGNADHATVVFLSEPALTDSDILSLLALGKKESELKGKGTGVGMSEAASFATGQFQDIFEQSARGLTGLDRFQVDPYVNQNDDSVPRVTVGKELVRNKVYVTYSSNVGATAPEQLFRIEYLLDRHFSLLGERDETGNNGADIKYRFEFK